MQVSQPKRDSKGRITVGLNAKDAFTTEKRWLCEYSRNQEGKLKLLSYDIHKLVSYGAMASLLVKGTIFTMDRTMLLVLLQQCVIAALAGLIILLDPNFVATDIKGLNDLSTFLGSFTPFALGLYIALAISRWWALRTEALAPVYNAMANICMVMTGALPHMCRYNELKQQVLKYGMVSVELMVRAARDKSNIEDILSKGMLDGDEYEIVVSLDLYQRAMIMWPWIMRLTLHAFEESKVPWGMYKLIVEESVKARDGIQTINTYLRTQVPFAYVHLITLIVNLNNIVVSVKSGMLISLSLRHYADGVPTSKDFWQIVVNIVTWFIVPVVYHGLLAISYIVHDPFGEDVLDFPVKAYTDYVFHSCEAMLMTGECPSEQRFFPDSARVQAVVQDRKSSTVRASQHMRERLTAMAGGDFTYRPLSDADEMGASVLSDMMQSAQSMESEAPPVIPAAEKAEDQVSDKLLPMLNGLSFLLRAFDKKLPNLGTAIAARIRVERSGITSQKQLNLIEDRRRLAEHLRQKDASTQQKAFTCTAVVVGKCQVTKPASVVLGHQFQETITETCAF